MMKFMHLMIFFAVFFVSLNIYAEKLDMIKNETCFSGINFSIVYDYIEKQISNGNKTFYKYDDFELYTNDKIEISLKDKGYTLARINKETGIYSLSIAKASNDRIVKKTSRIYCELLALANDNK